MTKGYKFPTQFSKCSQTNNPMASTCKLTRMESKKLHCPPCPCLTLSLHPYKDVSMGENFTFVSYFINELVIKGVR